MRKRIQNKIHHLRQQPDHVRHRAAVIFTISAGAALLVLWLVVMLPIQILLGQGGNNSQPRPEQQLISEISNINQQGFSPTPAGLAQTAAPRVGGVRTASPAASPAPKSSTLPVEEITE